MAGMTRTMAAALIALAGLVPVLAPGTARAELVDLGFYDGWNVMVDPDVGNGCLIQSGRDGVSLTRIGYDPGKAEGYIAIFNPDWNKLRRNQSYPLVADLDGQEFPVTATGLQMGNVHGAGVLFSDVQVYDLIAKSSTLTIRDDAGAALFTLDLKGTGQAIAAARKCQQEQG